MRNMNSIILEGIVLEKNSNSIIINCNNMRIPVLYHHKNKNININDTIRIVGKVENYNGNLVINSEYIESRLTN